jgi:hypothetical protein
MQMQVESSHCKCTLRGSDEKRTDVGLQIYLESSHCGCTLRGSDRMCICPVCGSLYTGVAVLSDVVPSVVCDSRVTSEYLALT